jgi:hypothetical protein
MSYAAAIRAATPSDAAAIAAIYNWYAEHTVIRVLGVELRPDRFELLELEGNIGIGGSDLGPVMAYEALKYSGSAIEENPR